MCVTLYNVRMFYTDTSMPYVTNALLNQIMLSFLFLLEYSAYRQNTSMSVERVERVGAKNLPIGFLQACPWHVRYSIEARSADKRGA